MPVRFSASDAERIDRIAAMLNVSRSEFMRLMYEDIVVEFEVDDEDVDDDDEEPEEEDSQ